MQISENCSRALEYASQRREAALKELMELLRFPTIAAQYPANREAFENCAAWLVAELRSMGFQQAEALATGGPPAIYAEWSGAGDGAPTLLIYGHYDVMPVDPLEEWAHPPFEPFVDERRIYARGASDDKGQLFAVLSAAQAWIQGAGGPPLNLKVILDGEEEELSPHLEQVLVDNRQRLRCDGVLIADMDGLAPQIPLVMYGVRGNCSLEVAVSGPSKDLHSGTYGGGVDNPLNVLARLLAAIQDGETRRILVPSFYERVKELTARQQALAEALPISDEIGLYLTGAPALGGEPDYPLRLRISARPTFEVHGVMGGYTGPGVKTVIPASAAAKISFRLAPDQQPEEICQQVQDFLRSIAPPTVQLSFKVLGMAAPATVDLDAPVVVAAEQAFRLGFGEPPLYVRGGGSLPILTALQRHIHPDALLTGFGLPDDGEHSPNESFDLGQFSRGVDTMIYYFELCRDRF